MMKYFNKTLYTLLLGTALATTACSPENVQPAGSRGDHTIGMPQGSNELQSPPCSDSVFARLQDATGGYTVNYCVPQFGSPCPSIPPEWARVTILNNHDSLSIRVTMAFSWFISGAAIGFDGTQGLQLDPVTGRPIVTNNWITQRRKRLLQVCHAAQCHQKVRLQCPP
jgi:hypothetical protein